MVNQSHHLEAYVILDSWTTGINIYKDELVQTVRQVTSLVIYTALSLKERPGEKKKKRK